MIKGPVVRTRSGLCRIRLSKALYPPGVLRAFRKEYGDGAMLKDSAAASILEIKESSVQDCLEILNRVLYLSKNTGRRPVL
jgi:hypothetical protein